MYISRHEEYFGSYLPQFTPHTRTQAVFQISASLAQTKKPLQTRETISRLLISKSDETIHRKIYSMISVGREEMCVS